MECLGCLRHEIIFGVSESVKEVIYMDNCSKCEGDTEGFKCDMCGAEAAEHDSKHACGGDHCMPKCKACSQAQVKCAC